MSGDKTIKELKYQALPFFERTFEFLRSNYKIKINDQKKRLKKNAHVTNGAFILFLLSFPFVFALGAGFIELQIIWVVSILLFYWIKEDIARRLQLLERARFFTLTEKF